ncbi:MAG TPA: UDP-N-acetylglucosamine 2-epimerase (non-hydrolyzing) [Sphingomicrobium sp.]
MLAPAGGQTGLAELGGRLRLADVWLVIGTRPEAIKLAPVVHALKARGIALRLVLTGQHPGLDPADHGLGAFDAVRLGCRGKDDPRDHALAVATHLADKLTGPKPGLIVVQGDTSSAMGGALAADALSLPLSHVEAGLRTHDLLQPWPEEEFRIAIDARSDLLFAPTDLSAANLRAEKVLGQIHVTGNTGIDAVLAAAEDLPIDEYGSPRILVTCHRRESWGEGLRSIAAALIELRARIPIDLVLHPNPKVAGTMRTALAGQDTIQLLPPCGHREMLARMSAATITLSDSGGMQEEAAAIGAPLLVLRDKTERPEAIATGNMVLVGTDTRRIVAVVRRLLADPIALAAMARPAFPYGDGRSGPRIAGIIVDWLAQRKRARSR